MKVLIPTAGIGSRLGDLTKHYNKALLAVGKRPVIAHIIDWYPQNAEFVIALGYYGDHIKEFLQFAYPDRKFEFVVVDHFEGTGSGLGYTLKKCKHLIDESFFFHANDTILKDKIDFKSFNKDTMFVSSKYLDPKKYRFIYPADGTNIIRNISDKTDKATEANFYSYVGVAYVHDFEGFRKYLDDISIEVGESDFFMQKTNVEFKTVNEWYDIGSVEQYREAVDALSDFENLAKGDEAIFFHNNKVIKFFTNREVVSKRVLRSNFLKGYIPELTEVGEYYYSYNFTPGALMSEKFTLVEPLSRFLSWANESIWKEKVLSFEDKSLFENECFKFYYDKTIARVDSFFTRFEWEDSEEFINGVKVPKLEDILAQLDWNWIKQGTPVTFHGDLHFENILETESGFVLIDWRQGFGNEIRYGDIYYDLAKLYHGFLINHKIIRNNLFNITIRESEVDFDFNRRNSLVECDNILRDFVIKSNLSWDKVEVLTALIFVNIAPLHHYPYSHLLYYLGKKMLWNHLTQQKRTL